MHEEWVKKLSDYLDGELADAEQEAVESHLAGCAACAQVLEDLKGVVSRAASIQPRPPAADLWPGIAARIDAPSGRDALTPFRRPEPWQWRRMLSRRLSLSLPQLAAAAVLLMAVSVGIAWSIAARPASPSQKLQPSAGSAAEAERPRSDQSRQNGADSQARVDDVQTANISFADQQYDAAVADLEKALDRGRGRLDAATIAIVEHNLQIIDQAIAQARQALAADPANGYLSSHLVEARRRKLDLLRRAAALTGESD
jgi:tetratricopeptide (TPR) repeat protein